MIRVLVVVLAVAAFSSCGNTKASCANSCAGCCSSSGVCMGGDVATSCGRGGTACVSCSALQTCQLGGCVNLSTGGGTGGAGGGGGSGGSGGTGGSGGASGNITFLWDFNGLGCVAAGVATVTIAIPGQTLSNNGTYPCETAGTAGIKLFNFAPGTYSWTATAKDSGGTTLFSSSGSAVVNGDVTVNAHLTGSNAALSLQWHFPANTSSADPSCGLAGVLSVGVSVDGATGVSVACGDGAAPNRYQIPNLAAGTHTVTLTARDPMAFAYYAKQFSVVAAAGQSTMSTVTLDWTVGSLPMKWTFSNGATTSTCAQAGVTDVRVDLVDSQNNYVYGTSGVTVPCTSNGSQSTFFQFLTADTYRVSLQAYGTGGALYRTNMTTWPSATVTAGQFPIVDGSTPVYVMSP